MKITPIDKRNPDSQRYAELMEKEIGTIRRDKKPPTITQCASSQRVLSMSKEELIEYRKRPNPSNWMANPDATNMDEMVGAREIDTRLITIYEGMRRSQKNTQGHSEEKGHNPEKIQDAVEAFTYSHPAELTETQKDKLIKIGSIKELESLPKKEKNKSIFAWFEGLFKQTLEPHKSFFEKLDKDQKEEWSFLNKEKK